MLRRIIKLNRLGWEIEAATNGLGNPPEWNPFFSDSVKRTAIAAGLESKTIDPRCVEPMNGRPKVLAVANIATHSLLTCQRHQLGHKAMGLSRTMNGAR
jgi:hypothetical protein